MHENGKKMLFISHAQKDERIVRLFIDLLYDIGLDEDEIFCSYISEIGIPIKVDIYKYLRDKLNSDDIIPIFVLSQNYYRSAACLNEMGAVWLCQKDYYMFLIPPFTFTDIKGAINPNKKGILLNYESENQLYNLRSELNQFKNQMDITFDLKERKSWERKRDKFIESVKEVNDDGESIKVDLSICEGFCIGHYADGACLVNYDKSKNEIKANIDFSLTAAEICSVVIYTNHINLEKGYENKSIYFEINSSYDISNIELECCVNGRNVRKMISLDGGWEKFIIPILDFGGGAVDWNNLSEIKFIVRRKYTDKGTIKIRNIIIK